VQLTINETPAVPLSALDKRESTLGKAKAEIVGVVLSADEATARAMRRVGFAHACAVAFIWLLAFGGWAMATPEECAFFQYFAPGAAAVTLAVFFVLYRVRRKRWLKTLPERVLASPPPGSPIRLDETGLTLGDRFTCWDEIGVDRVDISSIGEIYGSSQYSVDRVLVHGPDFTFCLDRVMLLNGQEIVNDIYRRKRQS
jgi:hypothetical protein